MEVKERTRGIDALFQASPLAMFALDSDWRVKLWNPTAARLFGWTEEEVLGQPLPIIRSGVGALLLMNEAIEQGAKFTRIEVCRKNGSYAIAEISIAPLFNDEDEPDGIMAIVADLTDRTTTADEALVHEHDLLHVLMESIPDTIYFKDTESRFIRINKAQAKTLGLSTPEDAIGKSDFDFFAPEHAEEAYSDEQRLISTRQPVISKREKIRVADGDSMWVSATKVPMLNKRGQVTGIAGISRDITAVVEAEEQLKVVATKLQRSNRELQDFASVASHDLQEPLRKIQAFGDRLKGKCAAALSDEGRDYLDRMQSAASRMQILINDLLTFSRVATKARPFVPVSLNEVVSGVLSDLEVRIEQTAALVEVSALPIIEADALQIGQVLQNLIGNALKFHAEGEAPVIKISAQLIDSPSADALDERLCEIRVADNGIGFEEKYLDRIFNVFQRLHGRGDYEGTGIGLAVCRKIVERHGGQITATSSPGAGSTFIIKLPLKHQQQEDSENEQTS
jgi:two-component system, LuxR family, sensor kinase FixL